MKVAVLFILCGLAVPRLHADSAVFRSIGAQDGRVRETTEISNIGDTGNVVTNGDLRTGDAASRQQVKLIVSFDTSSLPDDAYVTSATLRLRRIGISGANPHTAIGPAFADINLSGGFGGDPALAASDFEARADGAEVARMSNPANDGGWSEGALDSLGRRGINVAGLTQFRVYHIPEDNNNSIADYMEYYSGEAGPGSAPELVVEYITRPVIARPHSLIDPDRLHGFRTKWQKYFAGAGGATRASISPEMRGLDYARWAQAIERTGANGCSINVEARNGLIFSAQTPLSELTPEQISAGLFTPDQRNSAQMRFLLGLEEAREAGRILGTFRFSMHQRLYTNSDPGKEQEFVDDFVGFINGAKALRLDHWLRGLRLGENGIPNTNLWYSMDLAKRWAVAINAGTDDWLKTHGMEIHGAEMGIFFNNIATASNAATFFQQISAQTGYFTWCFKFFYEGDLSAEITAAGYDNSSAAGIKSFLRANCGFASLESFIATYRDAYPMHANCIFVGDSGDAMKLISNVEHRALTQMFNEAGVGFRGIMAVNGYSWEDETNIGNQYKAVYGVDPTGSDPSLNPDTYARWSAWPNIETSTTDPVIQADGRSGASLGFTLNGQIESGPAWLVATGSSFSGVPGPADLGVNAFRIRTSAGVEKTLLITVLDNLHIVPGTVSTRTAPGRLYQLETRPDLSSGSWIPTGTPRSGDGALWNIPFSTGTPAQFFRVKSTPSP